MTYFVAIAPRKRGRTQRLHLTATGWAAETLCGKYIDQSYRPRLWHTLDMGVWHTNPEQRCADCERHYERRHRLDPT